MLNIALNYSEEVMRLYEDAAFQCEGDLHILAVLVLFFDPDLKYTEVKGDFDNGTRIADYLSTFEKINNMKPSEIKTFMTAYHDQANGGMAYLREAIFHTYKRKLPKDKKIEEARIEKEQGSLF